MDYYVNFIETDEGDSYDTRRMTYSQALKFKLHKVNERVKPQKHMLFKKEEELQAMCLSVIAENIDYFIAKHNVEEKAKDTPTKTKRNLEFLRRVYSDKLYWMVQNRGIHVNNLMEFFLTPYWKNVRLQLFGYYHYRLFPKLKVMGKTITSLNLQDCSSSAEMLVAILCLIPNVVHLNLLGTECNISVLAFISKRCKSLETLNIAECKSVTDHAIEYLLNLDSEEDGFDSLKSLNLNGTEVTERMIPSILEYLRSLEHLKYAVIERVITDLYFQDMIEDTDTFNLTSFEPDTYNVGPKTSLPRYERLKMKDMLTLWTVICPKVTKVRIKVAMDMDYFTLISKFKHLRSLNLHDRGNSMVLSDASIFRSIASHLTEIAFKCIVLSVDVIIELCTNLKHLTLDNCYFRDFNMPESGSLNELESFRLKHIDLKEKVVDKSLRALLRFSENLVKCAIVYSSNFEQDLAECILDCPNLTILDVSFTDIKLETLNMIFASENIKTICTDGCPHIPRRYGFGVHVNSNPESTTCGWKISYGYLDDVEDEKWIDNLWVHDSSL